MSRNEKRYRVIHEEKSLRLFAFNNFVNGYRPQHGLDQPAIVLRTKIKKAEEHPALQWQQLAQLISERKPLTHSSFVMDATRLDANTEQDEITHRGVEGPLLKRMANMLIKLAPKKAMLIGAGSTAETVAKTAICCPALTKGIIGKVVLVCPQLAEVQRSVEAAERRQQQQDGGAKKGPATVEAIVILDAANGPAAPQWEVMLGKSFNVTIMVIPPGGSLFNSIATAVVPEQREEQPTEGSRLSTLKCYVITFRLSPYTKQAEQDIDLSPVTENPNLPPPDDDDEDDEDEQAAADAAGEEAEEPPIPSTESRYLLADLFHVKNARVRFEGNVVDDRTLANIHGKIELDELLPQLSGIEAGTTVSLSAQLTRDEDGRTTLCSSSVANLATGGPAGYYACGSNFPSFNYSSVHQYYGAALIRGRKIVLCRSLEGVWRGMRFPHRPHCEPFYTPMEAAMAAISDQCDVSADNFYFHPAVAPVTYYPPSEKGACVTLLIAFATNNSDGGPADDGAELLEQLHDSYDWYTYQKATAKLPTKAERDALMDIRRNVQRAAEAGLYVPLEGYGLFGEDIANVAENEEQSQTEAVAANTTAAGNSIRVADLVVIQDPFDSLKVDEVAAATRLAPPRVQVWGANENAWSTLAGGKACVVLPSSLDIDTFAQQELPPMLPEECPPQVRVVIAANPSTLEAAFLGSGEGRAKFMAAIEYADVLVSRSGEGIPRVIQAFLKTVRPELRFATFDQLAIYTNDGVEGLPAGPDDMECPELLSVPFDSKLPFHPERLNELLNSSPAKRWGCAALLWVSGTAWLSTSPLHSISIQVGEVGDSLQVAKAAPWWCCVEEGDRPEDLNTSDWDPIHGSRRQQLTILALADPGTHSAVRDAILSDLSQSLCAATEYRHWHRLANPFTL